MKRITKLGKEIGPYMVDTMGAGWGLAVSIHNIGEPGEMVKLRISQRGNVIELNADYIGDLISKLEFLKKNWKRKSEEES